MDKDELMIHNHTNIQELIRFVDQKAGALLVIYGFILTATVEFAKDLEFINPLSLKSGWESFLSVALFAIGFLLLALLIFQVYFVLFEIVKPRSAKNYTQEESSVLYFNHISKSSKDEFINLYFDITSDEIKKQMLIQIYEVSCIMSKKSENFNYILKFLFATVLCLLVFIYLSKEV
jgi:Family of unknown function (DUF5706)